MTRPGSPARKDIIFPAVDTSHDEGDPRWHEAGGSSFTPVYDDSGYIRHYLWNGLEPGNHARFWKEVIRDSWIETARKFEDDPEDIYRAWCYVDSHPAFWRFREPYAHQRDYPRNHVTFLQWEGTLRAGWPSIEPHKVNPDTGHAEYLSTLNTQLEWWYEFGPYMLHPGEHGELVPFHDTSLDGSAPTYEQAIVDIAGKMWEHYGNDRRIVDSESWQNSGE